MPWCPNCKNEYRTGIKTCADCGSELTEELLPDMDEGEVPCPEISTPSKAAEPSPEKIKSVETYVKKADRHEDMKSSGISFIGVSLIALALDGLLASNIISLNVNTQMKFIYMAVIGLIALIFMGIGLSSIKAAGKLKGEISAENEQDAEILAFFKEYYTEPQLPEGDNVSQDELFFIRNEAIETRLMTNYPDLTESYRDYICEQIYNELYI